jgi:hypothetical protein
MTAAPKTGRFARGFLSIVLISVAFLAAVPWLKSIDRTVSSVVGAAMSIFVMTYANYFAFRGGDEVQQASAGFAAKWGVPAGQAAFVLILMLTSFNNFTAAIVAAFAGDAGMTADRHVVVVAMMLGCWGVVLMQTIGIAFVNALWWIAKR